MGGLFSKTDTNQIINDQILTTNRKYTFNYTSVEPYQLKLSINVDFFNLAGSKILIDTINSKTGYKSELGFWGKTKYNDISLSQKALLIGDTTVNISIIVPKSNKVYIKDLSIEQVLENKSNFGSSLSSSDNKSLFYFIILFIAIILYLRNKNIR